MADLLADDRRARRRRKTIALVLSGLVVVMLVAALVWWQGLQREPAAVLEDDAAASVVLTGAQLMAAHENDPSLSELASGPLLVTAPLETTPVTGTTVLLGTADPLLDIAAEIDPTDATRLADLEEGTEVTLLCERIVPGLRAPALDGCTMITG